jgi:magnesium chelatase family protein
LGTYVTLLGEVGEFEPLVLDNMRQPLEEGVIRVARAAAKVTFPARVRLERQRPMRVGMGRRGGVDAKNGVKVRYPGDRSVPVPGRHWAAG